MKSSGVIALVAAGVVVGGGVATYELTRPSDAPVQVNFVEPAATTQPTTTTTTSAPAPSPTSTTTTKTAVAVTSSSTTHKATVRKEATVANDPAPAQTTTSAPAAPAAGQKPMPPGNPVGPTIMDPRASNKS